jgi:hypothetical protein
MPHEYRRALGEIADREAAARVVNGKAQPEASLHG